MPPNTPYPSQSSPGQPVPTQPPGPGIQSASQMSHAHPGRAWLIAFVVTLILLLGSIGFGVWAFMERSEFKNNVEGIVETEVAQAVEQNTETLEAQFVEREKEPFKDYNGPAAFGGVVIRYPKTWSATVNESGRGSSPLVGHFHPNFVPGLDSGTSFALKLEVLERQYDQVLKSFDTALRRNDVTVSPVSAKNVPGVTGARVDGEIARDKRGSVVLFPLRDKTIVLTTQAEQFRGDFDSIILENFSFSP